MEWLNSDEDWSVNKGEEHKRRRVESTTRITCVLEEARGLQQAWEGDESKRHGCNIASVLDNVEVKEIWTVDHGNYCKWPTVVPLSIAKSLHLAQLSTTSTSGLPQSYHFTARPWATRAGESQPSASASPQPMRDDNIWTITPPLCPLGGMFSAFLNSSTGLSSRCPLWQWTYSFSSLPCITDPLSNDASWDHFTTCILIIFSPKLCF